MVLLLLDWFICCLGLVLVVLRCVWVTVYLCVNLLLICVLFGIYLCLILLCSCLCCGAVACYLLRWIVVSGDSVV